MSVRYGVLASIVVVAVAHAETKPQIDITTKSVQVSVKVSAVCDVLGC